MVQAISDLLRSLIERSSAFQNVQPNDLSLLILHVIDLFLVFPRRITVPNSAASIDAKSHDVKNEIDVNKIRNAVCFRRICRTTTCKSLWRIPKYVSALSTPRRS